MRYKLLFSYLGTAYTGWQKTECGNSIEDTLQEALQTILQHPVAMQAASRTDRGVHAKGQVVDFATSNSIPPASLLYRLNQLLPKDMAAKAIELVPDTFHATLDAKEKRYTYDLCLSSVQLPFFRETSWHISYPLDQAAMRRASTSLLGTHDFSAFCNERSLWDRNPVCHLKEVDFHPLPFDRLQISLRADHFLYKMARNLIGTLVYIGAGKLQEKNLPHLLASCQRSLIGMTAPAHGLTLETVFYLDK